MTQLSARIFFSLALAAAATAASAADEPTIVGTGINANTFIPGHPASPRWKLVHANAEHPAVARALHARDGAVDANTFIVQPPASTTWLVHGSSDEVLRVAQAR